jgi:hypothetical protein
MRTLNVCFHLPEHWSIEQVAFLDDVLNQLQEAVWNQYGSELGDYWASEPLFGDEEEESSEPISP